MPNRSFSLIRYLSGLGADLMPGNPTGRSAGWQPSNPDGLRADWMPSNPPDGLGNLQPSNPPRSGKAMRGTPADAFDMKALQGWEGVDPPWTYADEHTLLTQALRKSRAKISQQSEAYASGALPKIVQTARARQEPLWRWAPKYRMAAVAAELKSRIGVQDQEVWLHAHAPMSSKPAVAPLRILELPKKLASLKRFDEREQIDAVLRAAAEREDRLPEILSQAVEVWPFFESVTGVRTEQAPEFAELLSAAHDWLAGVLMLLKHNIAARRPVQSSSLVIPLIPTPGHGSLPSGHATVAAFNAELLRHLMYPNEPDHPRVRVLDSLARRIAFNRVVAGVHFPVDSQVGYELGHTMARAVAALAGHSQELALAPLQAADYCKWPFTLPELAPDARSVTKADTARRPATAKAPVKSAQSVDPAPALKTLWTAAADSLARLRV